MGRTDAANEFGARVRTAHGDGWQVEGWARRVHGGGAQVVRGARLMASGLPTPMWNNADIEALDVDLEAIAAWYLARDVPWGVRLPAEWDLAIGQPLFTKRCFGMRYTDAPAPQATGGIHVQRAGVADLDIYGATIAEAFGDDPALAGRWIAPVLGVHRFSHWLARADGMPVGVLCTVRSDDRAGPAAMLTGLGVLPHWRGRGVQKHLLRAALVSAFADGATHAYASDVGGAEFLLTSGFVEVPGFLVRVVRPI